jgi:hypothetical protein
LVVDDRDIPADEAIEERGLPYVRTPNDGDSARAFLAGFGIHAPPA